MKLYKGIAVLTAAVLAAGTVCACGSSSTIGDYATTEVAKYGSESIKLEEANFWLRYQQMMNEAYYGYMYTYFGYDNMWTVDSGNGQTLADQTHTSVMQQLQQMRILNDHAADYGIELTDEQKETIAEHISLFLADYPNFGEYCEASEEAMCGYMELNEKAVLVAQAVKDSADVEVASEEVDAYKVEYLTFTEPAEESEAAEETAAEGETEAAETEPADTRTAQEKAEDALEHAQAGEELSAVAEEFEMTVSNASYLVAGEESEDIKYTTSAEMAAGDVQLVQDGESWVLLKKVNDLDADATEQNRNTAIEQKKAEAFNEQYAEWAKSAASFTVNEKIWEQITITDMIYEAPTMEETAGAETEAAVEEATVPAPTGEETAAAEETAAEGTAAAETAAAETPAEETSAAE